MNTKALRQKILDLAIRGKLVPQDPNDEPASVLLERIRAEKERLIAEGKIKRPKTKTSSSASPYQNFTPPFDIPASWVWARLEEICAIKGGKRIPQGKTFSKKVTSHIYIRVTDMKNNTIRTDDLKYIDDDVFSQIKNYTIAKDDLYLTIAGTIGSVGLVPDLFDGMNLTENAAKLTHISIDRRFLMYQLMASVAQDHFVSRFHQVAQPKLSIETASSTLLAIPPLEEQKRIAQKVSKLFEFLSFFEQEKSSLKNCVKKAKAKILELAMQGKLVPQDPADEPAADMLRRINPKAKILTDIPHYPQLPDNWIITAFTDVCESRLGKTLNSEKDEGSMSPYLCALNVKQGYFDLSIIKQTRIQSDEYERYSVINGDLLVCEGGDVGRAAIWEGDRIFYQNALHRVRPLGNILQKYLYYSLLYSKNKNIIDDLCSGVTIKHFTTKSMSKLSISLPPIAEQRRIVDKIEELFSILDKIEESLN